MNFEGLLNYAVEIGASDIHIAVGIPPMARIGGVLTQINDEKLTPEDTLHMVEEIVEGELLETLRKRGEVSLSHSVKGLGRFRVNVYRQRGSYSLALRTMGLYIPSIDELGLPAAIKDLARMTRGLVLVTGPSGSGKSTTLAAMIDFINSERSCHILTLEDPIEYLHRHKKSIVNQREIGNDCEGFATGLRSALRQDPDVIFVGEMRDLETISMALTAAETGHLVLSSMNTTGVDKTIERIFDIFPPSQQQQVRVQLSSVLRGIISQNLIPCVDGRERVAAVEIMISTPAISSFIREGKTQQINSSIQTGGQYGMQAMNSVLARLYKDGTISYENALLHCTNQEALLRLIGN